MLTYTAFTTLRERASADALGEAMERLNPEPFGVGVFEMEDGSGLWEVGGYFTERPDEVAMALLSVAFGANPFVISKFLKLMVQKCAAISSRWLLDVFLFMEATTKTKSPRTVSRC